MPRPIDEPPLRRSLHENDPFYVPDHNGDPWMEDPADRFEQSPRLIKLSDARRHLAGIHPKEFGIQPVRGAGKGARYDLKLIELVIDRMSNLPESANTAITPSTEANHDLAFIQLGQRIEARR